MNSLTILTRHIGRAALDICHRSLICLLRFPSVIPVNVTQVPARFDDIAHSPLELLGLGKAAIRLPVPQNPLLGLCGGYYSHNEDTTGRGLQSHFTEGEVERGE